MITSEWVHLFFVLLNLTKSNTFKILYDFTFLVA